MEIDELLTTTRSARKTLDLDTPADPAEIRECLEIALHAPNGSNQQSWRWLVVADSDLRAKIAALYRDAYLSMTGGRHPGSELPPKTAADRLLSSTEWLVEHLDRVPFFVIPCFKPYVRRIDGDESFYRATLYGSIFPAVWDFQLALHTRGYGTCITTLHLLRETEIRKLLGIPDAFVQGCLLPVARLRPGTKFSPTPRRPLSEVVVVDAWDGRTL